jgi:signal transduction histidine kinase
MPNILQRKGLRKALEEFVANMEPIVHFEFHFVFPEFPTNLNKEMELNIYRIIQEIVTNTIKHSDCTRLEIIFSKSENNLYINSFDNGVGFNQSEMRLNTTGCGISNIKNRINLLNGKIAIQSNPLDGTKYSIVIPNS